MLIEVPFKKEDVIVFKTISGDEVIARFVEKKSDGTLVVKRPLTMNLMMGPNGQGGVAMVPFMVGIDDSATLEFSKDHVIVIAKAQQAAADGYLQQTTGLAVPSAVPPKDLRNLSR